MPELEEVSSGANKIHCDNCGAELEYAPGTEYLICRYCQTKNDIREVNVSVAENDLLQILNEKVADAESENVESIACDSCGSITSFDDKTSANNCPFCGNHLMLKDAAHRQQIKPHGVLPFKIDHKEAHLVFRKWIARLWFAPNKLKRMANSPADLQGIYIPFWTFDADTSSVYSGMRGNTVTHSESYTEVVDGKPRQSTRQVSRIDWSPASGTIHHFFDDILELGSNSIPEQKAELLDPWDLQELVPFDEDYLRGFKVESYQVELPEAFKEGKAQIKGLIRVMVKRDIGGDHQKINNLDIEWRDLKFKLVLLPMWIASYPYKGKTFRFLVNGRTGEVQGERPYSAAKIATLVVGIIIVILLIVFLSQTQ